MKATWISIYIYYDKSPYDLLLNFINPILTKERKYIYKFFFIFYGKKFPHIRLRICVDSERKKEIILKIASKLEKNYSFKLHIYKRELKRYGGKDAITLAEDHFYISSKVVLSILKAKKNFKYSEAISNSILLQSILLYSLGYSQKKRLDFYDFLLCHKGNKIKYNFEDNTYKKIIINTSSLLKIIQKNKLPRFLDEWSIKNKDVYHQLENLKEKHILIQPPCPLKNLQKKFKNNFPIWHIYDSYFHMTNNRLGIKSKDETYIYYILYEALKKTFG